jgi:hypothetical protein
VADTVFFQKRNPSQVIVDRMNKARDAANEASDNYFDVLAKAQAQFNKVKELYPGMTFWVWASSNYPPLAAADATRKAAQSELYAAMALYFGPDAGVLSGYIDKIRNATTSSIILPG